MDANGMVPFLARGEPQPVHIERPAGTSDVLLVADHAGRRSPRSLGDLGVPAGEWERHIAWDIGIAAVVAIMAQALDATAISQIYSRLVIDCNRPLHVPGSIPIISEDTAIPGNVDLGDAQRKARADAIFHPYHRAIEDALASRGPRPTFLVAMHSFTPVYQTVKRRWHAGILYNRDSRFAEIVLRLLRAETELVVGDREPYSVDDDSDYTIPVHGERRNLPHVGIEIRQDLIADENGQREWAARMIRVLSEAVTIRKGMEAPG